MKKKIVTGITMGEPAGVSSEITLKTWRNHRKKLDPFIFFGDPTHLLQTCTKLKFKVPIKIISKINECFKIFNNYLPVYEIKLRLELFYIKARTFLHRRPCFIYLKGNDQFY